MDNKWQPSNLYTLIANVNTKEGEDEDDYNIDEYVSDNQQWGEQYENANFFNIRLIFGLDASCNFIDELNL
jgi:hypothetical protein